jgi:hypothetical protein
MNRFRSLSTSSLSTAAPENNTGQPLRIVVMREETPGKSAQFDPWTMSSSTALVVLPILPALES